MEWYQIGEDSRRAVGPAPSERSTPLWTAFQLSIGQRARSTVNVARSEQFPFPLPADDPTHRDVRKAVITANLHGLQAARLGVP